MSYSCTESHADHSHVIAWFFIHVFPIYFHRNSLSTTFSVHSNPPIISNVSMDGIFVCSISSYSIPIHCFIFSCICISSAWQKLVTTWPELLIWLQQVKISSFLHWIYSCREFVLFSACLSVPFCHYLQIFTTFQWKTPTSLHWLT